jgi:hypothetical protein
MFVPTFFMGPALGAVEAGVTCISGGRRNVTWRVKKEQFVENGFQELTPPPRYAQVLTEGLAYTRQSLCTARKLYWLFGGHWGGGAMKAQYVYR